MKQVWEREEREFMSVALMERFSLPRIISSYTSASSVTYYSCTFSM